MEWPSRWRRAALAVLVAGASLAAQAPAEAQQSPALPAPVILIVDMTQMLHEAKAAKAVQAVINQQFSVYSKEVAQQEDELKKARDDLERQRTVMANDAYTARARELQQRYDELGQVVQSRRQGLQKSYNDAMVKVENAALEAIADIVKERKANLVLAKQAVVFEAEGLDITAEAMTRLDKKLPTVQVNLPKPAAEPGKGQPDQPKKK